MRENQLEIYLLYRWNYLKTIEIATCNCAIAKASQFEHSNFY